MHLLIRLRSRYKTVIRSQKGWMARFRIINIKSAHCGERFLHTLENKNYSFAQLFFVAKIAYGYNSSNENPAPIAC